MPVIAHQPHEAGLMLGPFAKTTRKPEAAKLEVPENVTLKSAQDYKIIGQDIVNVDIDKIITGKPLFGLDYKAEGMKYVSVCRPPAFGQKIDSFDDSQAKTKKLSKNLTASFQRKTRCAVNGMVLILETI